MKDAPQRDPGPRTGRSGGPLGGLMATAGGLLLAWATATTWVARSDRRELAGIEVSEVLTTSGVEFSPWTVPLGVLAVIGGLLLLALPAKIESLRRLIGVVVALLGVGGMLALAVGVRAAAVAEAGSLRPAPGLAVLGALAMAFGGAAAVKRPHRQPVLSARHDIDTAAGAADSTDEWDSAAAEEEDPT